MNPIENLVEATGWDEREADEVTEVALRFVLSLFTAPGPARSRAELRAFLERRLVPALGLGAGATAPRRRAAKRSSASAPAPRPA